jgi:hypothetical protein
MSGSMARRDENTLEGQDNIPSGEIGDWRHNRELKFPVISRHKILAT